VAQEVDATAKREEHAIAAISDLLGDVKELLSKNKAVTEIMLNPDGELWIESSGEVKRTGKAMRRERAWALIRLLAGFYNETVTTASPHLGVKVPAGIEGMPAGARFQGLVPPVTERPCFALRFPPPKVMTLDDLAEAGTITMSDYMRLKEAVEARLNIFTAGGTGSGKTTLTSAILQEVVDDRVVVIEDNRELMPAAKNRIEMLTSSDFSVRDAVRASLRLRPDRIVVGEVRDGGTALELSKAWMTGHPGGLSTIHASSAESVWYRLQTLMMEEVVTPSEELINSATQLVVFIQKVSEPTRENGPDRIRRRVTEIRAGGRKPSTKRSTSR